MNNIDDADLRMILTMCPIYLKFLDMLNLSVGGLDTDMQRAAIYALGAKVKAMLKEPKATKEKAEKPAEEKKEKCQDQPKK